MSSRAASLVWVVSGPSGSGKTSLCEALLKDALMSRRLMKSVSYTTRKLRPGERQGVDYVSVTTAAFLALLRRGSFLEHERIFDAYYGTPKSVITRAQRAGKDVLLAIDVKGAATVRRRLARSVVSIFIMPPSGRALTARLNGRGTEDKKEIAKRLRRVKIEISCAKNYDYIVVNDDFREALTKIKAIMTAKRCEGPYVRTFGKADR